MVRRARVKAIQAEARNRHGPNATIGDGQVHRRLLAPARLEPGAAPSLLRGRLRAVRDRDPGAPPQRAELCRARRPARPAERRGHRDVVRRPPGDGGGQAVRGQAPRARQQRQLPRFRAHPLVGGRGDPAAPELSPEGP